ncbi:MAG: Gfo/Idh/MocA family oxidoreductase [Gemmataceae bacterium]
MTPTRREILATATGLTAAGYQRVVGSNDRIGVGFVGYGLMQKTHVSTFRAMADAQPVALAEVHAGRRAEGQAACGGQAVGYADFRKLLDDRRVEAVVVATPDHWHALVTMLACAAGKDVYVEKPLTLFVREGEWMQAVALRTRRVVQVGTQQRSGRHYGRARSLIRSGHIGQVHSVRMWAARNIGAGFGRPADCMPPSELDWDGWLGPAPRRPYNPNRGLYHFRWFWDTAGGQMTNLGAHHLDIVDWFLGLDELRAVASFGGRFAVSDNAETPDTQDALFRFDHWTTSMTLRESSAGDTPRSGLEFFGTKGSLSIGRSGFRVVADGEIPAVNMIPGIRDGHPVGGPIAIPAPDSPPLRTQSIDDTSGNSAEQYREHARNFLACIRSRKAPISDLASAHRTAVACHLANLSLRLGRQLNWDSAKGTVIGDLEAAAALVRPYRAPWDRELRALGVGP